MKDRIKFRNPNNTRLQPGVGNAVRGKPFQRFVAAEEKTVETVFHFFDFDNTGLKPGVNENPER
jgi:hypothetical protein